VLSRPLTLRAKATSPAVGGPARGPVGWWKLDETGGAEASDASGHRHTAQVRGEAHWSAGPGPSGGALELNGSKEYVDCGDADDFDFREGLTLSLWIKSGKAGKSAQTIIAKGSDAWRLYAEGGTGKLAFAVNGPQTTGKDKKRDCQATSKAAVGDGQWHHVVGLYDGRRIALYVDGEVQDTVAASGLLALNTEPLWLGNNPAAHGQAFRGGLDDVRLFGYGLSEPEIQTLRGEQAK
jgi:large repetitive protein